MLNRTWHSYSEILFPQDNLLDYFKASKLVQSQINPYFKLNHV